MIEWWWLIIEGFALIGYGVWLRGATRAVALADALAKPGAASAELARRWGKERAAKILSG